MGGHLRFEQAIFAGKEGPYRVVNRRSAIDRKLSDGADATGEGALRQSVHPQADLLARPNPAQVALADAELQLEGIGAPQGQQQISLLQRSADALLHVGCQNGPGHRRPHRGEAYLFIQQCQLLAQCVTADPVEPLFSRVALARCYLRLPLRGPDRCGRGRPIACQAGGAE